MGGITEWSEGGYVVLKQPLLKLFPADLLPTGCELHKVDAESEKVMY